MDKRALDELAVPLDPSRVATMTMDGQNIPYLEAHDVIRTANEVFGPGGWGFESGQPWIVEQGEQGNNHKHYEVWAVLGTLTVAGCPSVTDIGTNVRHGTGSSGLEMAIKGAASDALKRCLRMYGDRFGLVLYDRDVGPDEVIGRWRQYQQSRGQAGNSAPTSAPVAGSNPAPATNPELADAMERAERVAEMGRATAQNAQLEPSSDVDARQLLTKREVEAVCTKLRIGFPLVGAYLQKKTVPAGMTDSEFAAWAALPEAESYTAEKLVYLALRYLENNATVEATKTTAANARQQLHSEIEARKQTVTA